MNLQTQTRSDARLSASPARVCYVIDKLDDAGTERQLLALLKNLDRDRVEPFLCLLDGTDAKSREMTPDDCQVLRLGVKSLLSGQALRQARVLRRFLIERRIDVVQLHFPDSTYFAAPVARLAGVRQVIRTRRDLGYWMQPRDRVLARVYDRLFVDGVIANCGACRESLMAEGTDGSRIHVCENGIAMEPFLTIAPLDEIAPKTRVGLVANLRSIKDPGLFVRAAISLCERRREAQFHLAGKGELEAELMQRVNAKKLNDRIRFHGSVSTLEFLHGIDIAVLCSKSEGLSNAVLEYMAAGRAIVVTNVGGNPDLIADGVTGLVTPVGDADALAAAIERLLVDAPLAARLGAAARERVRQRNAWPAASRNMEDIYDRLLGRPTPRVETARQATPSPTTEHSAQLVG